MNNNKIIIFIIIVILIIIYAINSGIKIYNWQILAKDMISNSPSEVLDLNGDIIAEIGNNKNTYNISINDIPDNLKNAYISIEDQRFYTHFGIDIKRTSSAIISYIKNRGSSSFGGSTLTQQLVKNLTGDNSSTISRKTKEWIRALALESIMSKNEILEAYLNIIYVGPNIYGVNLGANYYFDKDIKNLSLEECAFLAGINNSPNSYNPFTSKIDNTEKINKRTKTVLYKMLELGYIKEEDYNYACSNVDLGLKFKNGNIQSQKKNSNSSSNNKPNIYSYHTDALITELVSDISKKNKISESFAQNYLEMSGLKIFSTQDTLIQNIMEKEFSYKKYILSSSSNPDTTSQAAMIIIDHTTGNVIGCVRRAWRKKRNKRV